MPKDFDLFMSQLKETNLTLDAICDFDKVAKNVEDIKLSLCMLKAKAGCLPAEASPSSEKQAERRSLYDSCTILAQIGTRPLAAFP